MKVFIIGASVAYVNMFTKLGYEVVATLSESSLVCFTGGADVSPHLYGETLHPTTSCNSRRDELETVAYEEAKALGIPMVGVCRGGQFLHVMNGGRLWQNVDNHAINGTHVALDLRSKSLVRVTSTHHQMMRLNHNRDGEVLCVARESLHKEYMDGDEPKETLATWDDIEVMWYKDTNCLCFQPHPEFEGADSTYFYFKNLLTECLGELS